MTDRPAPQPLITFAVIAFNQDRYIDKAVQAALAQTYTPLQILLSDDCSTDRTFDIMKAVVKSYSGPHDILLNRNECNLGLAEHLNRVAELASADFIILAAGDDISEPQRATVVAQKLGGETDIKAIVSGYSVIDEHGAPISQVVLPLDFDAFTHAETIAKKGGWIEMGAAFAYHRDCFRLPRPLPAEIQSEDRILPFRAALLGKIAHVGQPLLRYRKHDRSATTIGRFRCLNVEARHREVLLEDLEILRRTNGLPQAIYARSLVGLNRYVDYYRRLESFGPGLLARVYDAAYNYELTTRRILLRLKLFLRTYFH